ncbi:hypothetical protein RIF29_24809 [Crotalaria pallida]|uniref:Uncharacterized protein n=1 Tax=Crotalaria pallida TaxID=3830 RepID=A0AAN9HZ87_CROPI
MDHVGAAGGVALALYVLVAVLVPGGPLKLLVELASSRDEELPVLVYEARPTIATRNGGGGGLALRLLITGVMEAEAESLSLIELQVVSRDNVNENEGHGGGNRCGCWRVVAVKKKKNKERRKKKGRGPWALLFGQLYSKTRRHHLFFPLTSNRIAQFLVSTIAPCASLFVKSHCSKVLFFTETPQIPLPPHPFL